MASEATQECKYCRAPIGFYRGHRGSWLPSNPDGTPHRCPEYYAARKRRRDIAATDSVFDLEFPDIGNLTLPSQRRPQHSPVPTATEAADANSVDRPTDSEPVRAASAQWMTLPEEHLRLLLWFHQRAGTIVPYAELETPQGDGISAGTTLVTRAKGIYKPRWSKYALSVRQTLGSTYADQEPEIRPDGSWRFVYHQEEPRNVADPATFYTNISLGRNLADRVPVGVLIQRSPKPNTTYLVLGLAIVERWERGLFCLRGIPAIAGARERIPPKSLQEASPDRRVDRPAQQLSVAIKDGVLEGRQAVEARSSGLDGEDRHPDTRTGRKARVVKNRQVIELTGSARPGVEDPAEEENRESPIDGESGAIPLPGPDMPTQPVALEPDAVIAESAGEEPTQRVNALPATVARAVTQVNPPAVTTKTMQQPTLSEISLPVMRYEGEIPQKVTGSHVTSQSSETEANRLPLAKTVAENNHAGEARRTDGNSRTHRWSWVAVLVTLGVVALVLVLLIT